MGKLALSKMTRPELEEIQKNANFTEDEEKIYLMLSNGNSLTKISEDLYIPVTTLCRRIKSIKEKIGGLEMKKEVPIWEKTTLTLEEAAEYTNIGINKIRELSNNPRCTFVLYVGRKRLIKRKALEHFIEENLEV